MKRMSLRPYRPSSDFIHHPHASDSKAYAAVLAGLAVAGVAGYVGLVMLSG